METDTDKDLLEFHMNFTNTDNILILGQSQSEKTKLAIHIVQSMFTDLSDGLYIGNNIKLNINLHQHPFIDVDIYQNIIENKYKFIILDETKCDILSLPNIDIKNCLIIYITQYPFNIPKSIREIFTYIFLFNYDNDNVLKRIHRFYFNQNISYQQFNSVFTNNKNYLIVHDIKNKKCYKYLMFSDYSQDESFIDKLNALEDVKLYEYLNSKNSCAII